MRLYQLANGSYIALDTLVKVSTPRFDDYHLTMWVECEAIVALVKDPIKLSLARCPSKLMYCSTEKQRNALMKQGEKAYQALLAAWKDTPYKT